jgi:hypothetical protein
VREGESPASGDFSLVGLAESVHAPPGSSYQHAPEGAKAKGAREEEEGEEEEVQKNLALSFSSCAVAQSFEELWAKFACERSFACGPQGLDQASESAPTAKGERAEVGGHQGSTGAQGACGGQGGYGGLSISRHIPAGERVRMTLVFSWYLPFREHAGQKVGNAYAHRFANASHVARHTLDREAHMLEKVLAWNQGLYRTGLPVHMSHMLLNSLGTFVKTGLWTGDGRWRQYESFSCNDVEPVHLHGYRSIPLTYLFPDLTENILDKGFGITQLPCSGYVPETLGEGRPRLPFCLTISHARAHTHTHTRRAHPHAPPPHTHICSCMNASCIMHQGVEATQARSTNRKPRAGAG